MIRNLYDLWTLSQRRVLIVLVAIGVLALSIQLWRRSISIADPPPAESPRGDEIADRLDPNTANAAALAAIPTLGEKRAKDIVDYRENFVRQYPGQLPFTQPEDLMRIKGIGMATVTNVSPYLLFQSRKRNAE